MFTLLRISGTSDRSKTADDRCDTFASDVEPSFSDGCLSLLHFTANCCLLRSVTGKIGTNVLIAPGEGQKCEKLVKCPQN